MIRSLWTASSGMRAQQLNVDTISNNIANINTTSYKKERLEFKSLLYQTLEKASLDASTNGKPVNLQVGLGVRPIATSRMFTMGSLQGTENPTDVALDGEGYFIVNKGNDEIAYTRDGSFKISSNGDVNQLTTSEGYYILDTEGNPISMPSSTAIKDIVISSDGSISINGNGSTVNLDVKIGIVQFANPQGLKAVGGNLYENTIASGEPLLEEGSTLNKTNLTQGYLEMSNVNIAEEMVNLIIAQRAYELNSKAITTVDEMLQQANNLKR